MKNLQNNLLAEEHISKGDAGTASAQASKKVAEERAVMAIDDERADIVGTDQDMEGRVIPQGGILDDIRIRELGRFFDVPVSEFRDAGKDLAEILGYMGELTNSTSMSDILVSISEMEELIKPSHGLTPRYKHFYNYILEKIVENDVRKRVSAWEK